MNEHEDTNRHVTGVLSWVAGEDPRHAHLRVALFLALLLHLILAVVMPDLPEFQFANFSRESGLNVFIQKAEEPEPFAQQLNQQLPHFDNDQTVSEPRLDAASPEIGDEDVVTDESPQIDASNSEVVDADSRGETTGEGARPVIRFDYSTVKLFVQQDAVNYANRYPEQLARFARSFSSYRNVRRRTDTESFRNRLGDQYVRASSSEGDICYKQERDNVADEYATNTVYFFRCGRKPLQLNLGPEG